MSKGFTRAAVGVLGLILITVLATSTALPFQTGWRIWEQHAVETPNQVAYGGFENAIAVHKFGRNTDIDAGSDETVWNIDGFYVWPTGAETVTVVSTDTEDDGAPAGDGALTLRVIGLDANYDDLSEDIILDGTTPVVTTGEFLRVFRAYVLTVGADGSNAGAVSATQTSSGFDLFNIQIGKGQTVLGLYTVADGKTLLVDRIFGSIGKQASVAGIIELRFREETGAWRSVVYTGVHSQGLTTVDVSYKIPLNFGEKVDIEIRAGSSGANADINAGFDGYLITVQ